MTLHPLHIRKTFGRDRIGPPVEFGPTGWLFDAVTPSGPRIIVTTSPHPDIVGCDLLHASISYPDRTPTYDDLTRLHQAVFGDGWAYQVFAPPAAHINIHPHTLHLWGRLDGAPMLPDFTLGAGTI